MLTAKIEEIARVAALAVLNKKEEIISNEFDARYHDVKLLMRNYRRLKIHYSNISAEFLEVSSICSLRHKTKLMMSHVDKMLIAYKALCESSSISEELRRWNALYLRYIAEEQLTIDDIACQLFIEKRTYYRDINRALMDLAVLLFGIEAIGTWKPKRNA